MPRASGPPLLFGLRLWASVCLALYVAFWLELDNPFWAGTSAAIVCQPQLGASLRKGWFRMIGTIVGAVMIVVPNACFPQDRIAFLTLLALWFAICAFAATLLRNFASYAAALAGYTVAIIAADTLGATGGPDGQVFMLAVTRASEICIGIVCAGIVLAGTDFGGSQRQLAALFAGLAAEITGRFAGMLAPAGSQAPDTASALPTPTSVAVRVEGCAGQFAPSPRGDQAYAGAIAFTAGTAGGVLFAALIKFAVLPGLQTFPAFCVALGLFLIPAGFLMAQSQQPVVLAAVSAMAFNFMPVLAPTNQMRYDTAQFYNSALAIFVGCAAAPLSFRLLPPLSPELRARRLLALTLRDLRSLANGQLALRIEDWQGRVYARIAALPDQVEPLQRGRFLAAVSVGSEIVHLRLIAPLLGFVPELNAALTPVARGDSCIARAALDRLDCRLAAHSGAHPGDAVLALRARARILVLAEAISDHADYFGSGALA
jgi:uncharacterized membrane protein YccC